jgi:hypothetical protein
MLGGVREAWSFVLFVGVVEKKVGRLRDLGGVNVSGNV